MPTLEELTARLETLENEKAEAEKRIEKLEARCEVIETVLIHADLAEVDDAPDAPGSVTN